MLKIQESNIEIKVKRLEGEDNCCFNQSPLLIGGQDRYRQLFNVLLETLLVQKNWIACLCGIKEESMMQECSHLIESFTFTDTPEQIDCLRRIMFTSSSEAVEFASSAVCPVLLVTENLTKKYCGYDLYREVVNLWNLSLKHGTFFIILEESSDLPKDCLRILEYFTTNYTYS